MATKKAKSDKKKPRRRAVDEADAKETKRRVRSVAYTEKQDEEVCARAHALGLDVSQFIRMASLNAAGAGHLETSKVKDLEKALKAVGGRV